jgi:DNA-binding IclR family transcriptional regulator
MRVVPALDRGLRILALLAESRTPIRVAEVARLLGLPRSATYELVHTLSMHDVIRQLDTGEVALGPALLSLGNAYGAELDLEQLAHETVARVTAESDETSQVGVLDGREVYYIAKADSPRSLSLASTVGVRLPAHCTALGKILLAMLPGDELERRLALSPLERLTEQSITDAEELRQRLREARSQRFAWEECESNPNVACVAAPVLNDQGIAIAAISVSLPLSRMNAQRRHQLKTIVVDAAHSLSAQFGRLSPRK